MKYPYTDSTDIVIYQPKEKHKRKPKLWAVCLAIGILSSTISSAVVGGSVYYIMKNNPSHSTSPSLSENLSPMSTTIQQSTGSVRTIPEIAEQVGPSCVGIINKTKLSPQKYYDPFTGRYFYTSDPNNTELVEQGSGSGIIISSDGYIVTNQHVIEGASEILVILNTGDEYTATLVGADSKSDLAVLKINKTGLPAATLGNSETIRVGELAVAIGNPLGQELAGSVTAGVVSAVNRTMTVDNKVYNLIQTDAAINPGNSGGALVNQYGEVIGINTIKLSSDGVEGIGFAIAISEAKPIIDDLINNGYVSGRPLVGIKVETTRNGLSVVGVTPGSGAANAGLLVGDLIVKAEDKVIKSTDSLNEIRDTKKPGETLKLSVIRNGEMLEIKVVLGEDIPMQED